MNKIKPIFYSRPYAIVNIFVVLGWATGYKYLSDPTASENIFQHDSLPITM